MSLEDDYSLFMTRRQFFSRGRAGIGLAALGSLLKPALMAGSRGDTEGPGLPGLPHFAPRAKRAVFLFQSVTQLFFCNLTESDLRRDSPVG